MKSIQKLLIVVLSMFLCATVSSAYLFDSLMPSMDRPSIELKVQKKKAVVKRQAKVIILSPEIKIQKSLHELGFYYGRINGLLSHPRSLMAIKEMNIRYSRKKGDILDQEAKDSLITLHNLWEVEKKITLSKSKKFQNRRTQLALKHLGYYEAKIDGSMGKKTRKAIKNYLKAEGLKKLTGKENIQLIKKAKVRIAKEIAQILSILKSESIPIQGFYVPSPEILQEVPSTKKVHLITGLKKD